MISVIGEGPMERFHADAKKALEEKTTGGDGYEILPKNK